MAGSKPDGGFRLTCTASVQLDSSRVVRTQILLEGMHMGPLTSAYFYAPVSDLDVLGRADIYLED
jgi:hypothetical protein